MGAGLKGHGVIGVAVERCMLNVQNVRDQRSFSRSSIGHPRTHAAGLTADRVAAAVEQGIRGVCVQDVVLLSFLASLGGKEHYRTTCTRREEQNTAHNHVLRTKRSGKATKTHVKKFNS
jgi:hypothetical protein